MSTAQYALLVAIVVAAVPVTVWLKREGDRRWLIHKRRERVRKVYVRLIADTHAFQAAMRDVTRAMNDFNERMSRPLCRECGPGYRIGDEGCRHEEGCA